MYGLQKSIYDIQLSLDTELLIYFPRKTVEIKDGHKSSNNRPKSLRFYDQLMLTAVYLEKRKEVWSNSLSLLTRWKRSGSTSCYVCPHTEPPKHQQGFGALLRWIQTIWVIANTLLASQDGLRRLLGIQIVKKASANWDKWVLSASKRLITTVRQQTYPQRQWTSSNEQTH